MINIEVNFFLKNIEVNFTSLLSSIEVVLGYILVSALNREGYQRGK